MTASRVFFPIELPPSRSDRDFSSASKYGTLHFAISQKNAPTLTPGPAMVEARKNLKDFDPEKDYVSWAGGDPLAMLVMGVVLRDLGLKEVKFLRFDRTRDLNGERVRGPGFYTPVTVRLQA